MRVADPLDEVASASAIAALADDAVNFEEFGAVLESEVGVSRRADETGMRRGRRGTASVC